jgi:amino acid transporter
MPVGGALEAAIARSRGASTPEEPVYSPLRALGRRQLSPIDLLGQSLSTIAPATGMIFIAQWVLDNDPGYLGLAAIAASTAIVVLVALCVTQFTRRLAAAGSLYSFAFHGLPVRATLTAGAALLVGYLGISVSVLANAANSVVGLLAALGFPAVDTATAMVIVLLAAALVTSIAIRGVRFAARAVLVIEACSLILIIAVILGAPASDPVPQPLPPGATTAIPFLAMLTVFSMAGFESAGFFGPEARRPLLSVTRAVLVTPIVCGAVFIFAGWAALSGRGATIVDAYFDGTASGAAFGVVLAVKIGITCSWFASTLGCAQAASRLLYSMGFEGVLPGTLSRVHRQFRTPYVAVAWFTSASAVGATLYLLIIGADAEWYGAVVEIALVVAYTLVAVSCLRFLQRIGEHSTLTRVSGLVITAAGTALLVFLVGDSAAHGRWLLPAALAAVAASGTLWHNVLRRTRPQSLSTIGAFDSVETADLLPGAGRLFIDDRGRRRLLPTAEGPDRRSGPGT